MPRRDLDTPRFAVTALPEEEQEAAWFIQLNLGKMASEAEEFRSSYRLFEYCSDNMIPFTSAVTPVNNRDRVDWNILLGNWQLIAARNGALVIYDIYRIYQELGSLRANCPSLFRYVVDKDFGKFGRRFEIEFPGFAKLRNAAAHKGEHASNPKKFRDHLTQDTSFFGAHSNIEPGSRFYINGSMVGKRYMFSVEGGVVGYELSSQTVETLYAIVDDFFDVWRLAENTTLEIGREMFEKDLVSKGLLDK